MQTVFPQGELPHWIPQGGTFEGSIAGVSILAEDLVDFIRSQSQLNPTASGVWKVL
jgi:hypothetical protein